MNIHPIDGVGQNLKVFEQTATYVSRDETSVDSDGYVRGGFREDEQLKVAVVESPDEEYDVDRLGENIIGVANIYIRAKGQGLNIDPSVGDLFIIDDVEWKILEMTHRDSVIKCMCGRVEGGGISAIG